MSEALGNQRKVSVQRTRLLKASEHSGNYTVGCKVKTSQKEDMVEGCPAPLDNRNQKLQLLAEIQEELCYLLNSGLAWREIPSMTPMGELRPLPLTGNL